MKLPHRYALAAFAGVIFFLGFADYDVWPLSFLSFVPVMFAVEWGSPLPTKHVVGITLTAGFVGMFGGYYWVAYTLRDFSGFPLPLCLVFASLLFVYQGLLFTLYFGLFVRARRMGWPPVVTSVAALAAVELVFPLLFPSYFGATFHSAPILVQIVDLGGPILLGAVMSASNGAVYSLLRSKLAKEPLPKIDTASAFVFVALTLAYGAFRMGEVDDRIASARAQGESFGVGVVQGNVDVFDPDIDAGVRRYAELSNALEREHPDVALLVWPEAAFLYSLPEDVTNIEPSLPDIETPIVFGGLAVRGAPDRLEHSNTAFLVDVDGEIRGAVDKVYLLAFGEYLPFGETFPILYDWSPNSGHYVAGDAPGTLALSIADRTITVGVTICYEDILPRFVRDLMHAPRTPDVLVNLTSDAWFGDTSEPWHHLALAKLRAVEHHRYLVRATTTGVSAIVDPAGRVLASTETFVADTAYAPIVPLDGMSLYARLGDWPGYLGACVIAALCLRKRRAVKRR